MDRTFVEQNQISQERMQQMAGSAADDALLLPVGEHWTVAVVFAHLAWWDRRVMYVLDMTARDGKLFKPEIDIFVNDLSLPLWLAVPARVAVRIGIESAQEVDRQLEAYPEDLLEVIHAYNPRWVIRALHRNEHLDQAEMALRG